MEQIKVTITTSTPVSIKVTNSQASGGISRLLEQLKATEVKTSAVQDAK